MRKLISLLLFIAPFAASAQKNLFLTEFNGVNNWFFTQPKIALVQKYVYYNDSTMVQPVDSTDVIISKTNTAIDYKANGLESFCDSGYMVKINHTGKYMIVSKTAKTDTAQLKAIFNEGFSGFAAFRKTGAQGISTWELSGGKTGINSASLVLDLKNKQIKSLEMVMSGNHPLVSAFNKPGQAANPMVTVKVAYRYLSGADAYNTGALSDFIAVDGSNISASAKYSDYRIKLATEKQ